VRVAHMIAREESWFSAMLMASSLRSVAPAVDKIILIDNGCSDLCVEIYEQALREIHKDHGVDTDTHVDPDERNFSNLRNMCIDAGQTGDIFIKLDADDVHYAKGVKEVFDYMDQNPHFSMVIAQFYHHRRDPWQYQSLHRKDIFFRQHEDTRWEKSVHESLEGLPGKYIECDYKYHHFGYCKSRSELLSHWINYDVLEFGKVERYDMSSVETVDPNKDMHGQFKTEENQKYNDKFPAEVDWMFDGTLEQRGMKWDETGLVGSEFDPLKTIIEEYQNDEQSKEA
jgi:glycosyltransferase involved in cell wall biosynthesis